MEMVLIHVHGHEYCYVTRDEFKLAEANARAFLSSVKQLQDSIDSLETDEDPLFCYHAVGEMLNCIAQYSSAMGELVYGKDDGPAKDPLEGISTN